MGPGLMICTYRTLLGKESGGPVTRIGQLLSWVGGEGWDGVLALDEAHKAKNLVQQKKRWMATPSSKTAVVVDALQKRLREARVIYASATIATNAGNMESLSRLGLWGPGTAFQTSGKFAVAMHNAGLPGLELLSTNMKLQGKYLARTLGFKVGDGGGMGRRVLGGWVGKRQPPLPPTPPTHTTLSLLFVVCLDI